ncbi:hypothetical protein [Desulfobacter sp.]|uniref:hypothetical protein n=1 Tax=Desulfobacter sp. TaxID=2294 RepID=UPI003D0A124C
MVDDADCAYTLDIVQEDYDGTRTVKFENFKARGDVALEAFYQYNYLPGTLYYDRLDSVSTVDDEERKRVEQQHALDVQLRKNRVAVDAIIECIQGGIDQKTVLITEAAARSGISKPKIRKALIEHTGPDKSKNQFWYEEIGVNNSHIYRLNYGVSDAI